ncbi:hypothetical protein ACP4OV_029065 [Aristida adscensionis]
MCIPHKDSPRLPLRSSSPSAALRPWRAHTTCVSARVVTPAVSTSMQAGPGKKNPWAEYVPVCGALGATALSVTLGVGTARHELANAPNVRLDKRKREAVPEVAAPDLAVDEADRFLRGSLFRRLASVAAQGRRRGAAGDRAEQGGGPAHVNVTTSRLKNGN